MTGRALTNSEKACVTNRILAAWLRSPEQRLGQLIVNAAGHNDGDDSHIYYVEDNDLVTAIESFVDANAKG